MLYIYNIHLLDSIPPTIHIFNSLASSLTTKTHTHHFAMECSGTTKAPISPSYAPSSPPVPLVVSPCAACKILRRRCAEKCVLAPYFPPSDPIKFTTAHRVFGASNIIKFLQELPEYQRADAVSSMVYEANARIRDPVYGCAGAICQLQKQVNELQAQLAKAQAEVVTMQCQYSNLMTLISMDFDQSPQSSPDQQSFGNYPTNDLSFLDDNNSSSFVLDSLWS